MNFCRPRETQCGCGNDGIIKTNFFVLDTFLKISCSPIHCFYDMVEHLVQSVSPFAKRCLALQLFMLSSYRFFYICFIKLNVFR